MKTITATIVYPVSVSIQVVESLSKDEIWNQLVSAADLSIKDRSTISPVIYDCSLPDLISKKEVKKAEVLETQADIFQFLLNSLKDAQGSLQPLSKFNSFMAGIKNKKNETLDLKLNQINVGVKNLIGDLIAAMTPKRR